VVVVAQSQVVVEVLDVLPHCGGSLTCGAHWVYVHCSSAVPQNVGYRQSQPGVVVVVELVELVGQAHRSVVVVVELLVTVVPPSLVVVVELVDVAQPSVSSVHSALAADQTHLQSPLHSE
jgi:hypothetical protein